MSQIGAIALLAVRGAVRSRVVAALYVLLLAAAVLFPSAIRSDGTADGFVRLHLTYSLGLASFLLGLASLWAGADSVSREADDKTIQLLLVKPVPRRNVWLGKWLGILAIDAILLALAGSAVAISLRIHLLRGGFDPDSLAHARLAALSSLESFRSPLPDVEPLVRAECAQLLSRGILPADAPMEDVAAAVRNNLLAKSFSVPPGESLSWSFDLPPADRPAPLLVRFRCDSSIPGASDVRASVSLEWDGLRQTVERLALPGTVQTVAFDVSSARAGRAVVSFANLAERPVTLFFDPADGLVLRRARGSFAANFARSLALVFFRLALFAAVGVSLGTLFSMPVAAFLSLVLVLVLQLSGFVAAAAKTDRNAFVANVASIGHGHSHAPAPEAEPSPAARALASATFYAYRATYIALAPLIDFRAVDDVASAVRIPPRQVLAEALRQGILFPAFLAAASTAVLRRREWALPGGS